MSGSSPPDQTRWKLSTEARIVSIYCGCLSVIFVIVALIVKKPISTMMISNLRKEIGTGCYTLSISFFLILAFKTSRSKLFIFPALLSILLLTFIIILIFQEPRYGFNKVKTETDALPYCFNTKKECIVPYELDCAYTASVCGTAFDYLARLGSW